MRGIGGRKGGLLAIARRQRGAMSRAELRLWELLKNGQVAGHRFRRQHLLGNQIVDFYCPAERIVIEVARPGPAPLAAAMAAMDEALRQRGFTVIRLADETVLRRPDTAVLQIYQALHARPSISTARERMLNC
jgi:very-short-patch-repair endonuclease